jgi:hypothetical protein
MNIGSDIRASLYRSACDFDGSAAAAEPWYTNHQCPFRGTSLDSAYRVGFTLFALNRLFYCLSTPVFGDL